jgi:hypothetical protein
MVAGEMIMPKISQTSWGTLAWAIEIQIIKLS